MTVLIDDDTIHIEKLQLGPFGTNAYIMVCQKTGDSLVVDAPAEAATLIKRLQDTSPKYILLTHDHMDHIGALSELRSGLKVPLGAHALDSGKLAPPPEIMLKDGDTITLGNLTLEVLHTPGHTPGSLCFMTGKYLISGDTLFPGGPGKSWSPADLKQMVDSITTKLFVLPDDTQVYPGHGETTVLKKEKEEYAVFASRPHDPEMCGDVLWLSS
jgi:hydroxyacylglutathione hydrolase